MHICICGAKYEAIDKGFSLLSGLYGAGVMLYLPFLIFVPLPMWLKLYVVPLAYLAVGYFVWVRQALWVVVARGDEAGPNNSFKPNPHRGGA